MIDAMWRNVYNLARSTELNPFACLSIAPARERIVGDFVVIKERIVLIVHGGFLA